MAAVWTKATGMDNTCFPNPTQNTTHVGLLANDAEESL
jgi:hypothetical protein